MTVNRIINLLVTPATDEQPYVAVVTPDLETFQSMVGRFIKAVRLANGIVYCSENGKCRSVTPAD